MSSKKTREVSVEIEISASMDDVWEALTDANELTRWFPLEARVEPGPQGTVHLSWGKDFEWNQRIEIWNPPGQLKTSYEVRHTGEGAPGEVSDSIASEPVQIAIDYRLESRAGRTRLRLVHSGFLTSSDWDDEYDGVRRGWGHELSSLRHYLERHQGRNRSVAWARALLDAPVPSIWKRL